MFDEDEEITELKEEVTSLDKQNNRLNLDLFKKYLHQPAANQDREWIKAQLMHIYNMSMLGKGRLKIALATLREFRKLDEKREMTILNGNYGENIQTVFNKIMTLVPTAGHSDKENE